MGLQGWRDWGVAVVAVALGTVLFTGLSQADDQIGWAGPQPAWLIVVAGSADLPMRNRPGLAGPSHAGWWVAEQVDERQPVARGGGGDIQVRRTARAGGRADCRRTRVAILAVFTIGQAAGAPARHSRCRRLPQCWWRLGHDDLLSLRSLVIRGRMFLFHHPIGVSRREPRVSRWRPAKNLLSGPKSHSSNHSVDFEGARACADSDLPYVDSSSVAAHGQELVVEACCEVGHLVGVRCIRPARSVGSVMNPNGVRKLGTREPASLGISEDRDKPPSQGAVLK